MTHRLPPRQTVEPYTLEEFTAIIREYQSGHLSTDEEITEVIGATWFEGHAEALDTHGIKQHNPRDDLVINWLRQVFGTPPHHPPTEMTV